MISVNVTYRCDYDLFSFNKEYPKGLNPELANLFVSVPQEETFLILRIVKVINRIKILEINLKDRFVQSVPTEKCPLTKFKIIKVRDNKKGIEIDKKEYSKLFEIDNNGTFKVLVFD